MAPPSSATNPTEISSIALDAEERAAGGRGAPTTTVRLGCSIDPDWLADVEGGDLRATDVLELDAATERVVRRSRLAFGALTLDETVRPAEPSPEVSRLLAEAAARPGPRRLRRAGRARVLRARLQLLARAYPRARRFPRSTRTRSARPFAACEGLRSFSDLRAVGWRAGSPTLATRRARAPGDRRAPAPSRYPAVAACPVHYEADQPPWIESRLQDFFGLARGPSVAGGPHPLTLHLLAPNGRAVQVTSDLDSFWRNHYPALRRELGRRYPRHAWPEDGRTATPPPPRPPRAAPSGRRVTSGAERYPLRYLPGVTPARRLKTLFRCDWLVNPHATAITAMGMLGSRNMVFARSTRRPSRYW